LKKEVAMFYCICLTLFSSFLWTPPDSQDVLILDSLGYRVKFGTDYDYTTGDIYLIFSSDSGDLAGIPAGCSGFVIFKSDDHGQTWYFYDSGYFFDIYPYYSCRILSGYSGKIYHAHALGRNIDNNLVFCVKDSTSEVRHYIGQGSSTSEFTNVRIEKDNFPDQYIYLITIKNVFNGYDTLRLMRTADDGYNWDTLKVVIVDKFIDCDVTTADSSIYYCYADSSAWGFEIVYGVFRDRGTYGDVRVIVSSPNRVLGCRIGATTVQPDTSQIAYLLYSAVIGGNCALLCCPFKDTVPYPVDTIVSGIPDTIMFSIKGYQASPNQWIDMAYTWSEDFYGLWYRTYWQYTNTPYSWSSPDTVNPLVLGAEYVPEIVYSPGASAPGSGVVYYTRDNGGALYFDAPWITSGIEERFITQKLRVNSTVLYRSGYFEFNKSGIEIYDHIGREVHYISGKRWDLKAESGKPVSPGIYFAVKKETGEVIKLTVLR